MVQSIGLLYRHNVTDKQGEAKESHDVALFISSLPPRVRRLNQLLRDHWSIENSEHYVLDVVFTEDASRIPHRLGPEVAAAFRRLSLNAFFSRTGPSRTSWQTPPRARLGQSHHNNIYTIPSRLNMRLPCVLGCRTRAVPKLMFSVREVRLFSLSHRIQGGAI
ncbi:MAG: hypothetical protein R3B91_20595 [Planctomycetaceae bacterium]